jgi:hypothetical protein
MIAALDSFNTSVGRGDLAGAGAGCEAMKTNYKSFLVPTKGVPDPDINQVLEDARDAAYYAQKDCQAALKGDPVKLAQVKSEATTAEAKLNQVLDLVQASPEAASVPAPTPTEAPEPTPQPADPGASLADWNDAYAQNVVFMIAALTSFNNYVSRGDLLNAGGACQAMRTNYKSFLVPTKSVPEPAIDQVLEDAKDAAYYAQKDCQAALKNGGDPVKLPQVKNEATTALTKLNQVLDQVQAAPAVASDRVAPPANNLTSAAPLASAVVAISKKYGAALRVAPDSNAKIVVNIGCGSVLPVLQAQAGWFQVRQQGVDVWVGGARVVSGSTVAAGACVGAPIPTYQMGDTVHAQVASGCLSVRPNPYNSAPITECVPNGYQFTLNNGPVETDPQDWYGVASVTSQLNGWSRADYLVR